MMERLVHRTLQATTLAACASTLLLSGCGSWWTLREGDSVQGGCVERQYFPDADGDGWGDPASEPTVLCQADANAGLTATNARDCDDNDVSVTGKVGQNCPVNLAPADPDATEPVNAAGVVFAEREFAFTYGQDFTVDLSNGESSCELWGVTPSVGIPGVAGLATFVSQAELAELQGAVEAGLEPGQVFAGRVGIGWSGSDLTEPLQGEWVFVDGLDSGLIESALSWCNGEPSPVDFFPSLNLGVPEHKTAMEAALPELRLSLVLREDATWCLGLSEDAVPESELANVIDGEPIPGVVESFLWVAYLDGSHTICSREAPVPDNHPTCIDCI